MSTPETMKSLLLSYITLTAERNSYGPGDGYEYILWDDLHGDLKHTQYVSEAEAKEIIYLVIQTDCWVTFNLESGVFQLIDIDAWMLLLAKRGH
jgi:hypothetical protein